MTEAAALPLNHLANTQRGAHLTGEVPFSIGCLQLSHQGNGHHATSVLPVSLQSILVFLSSREEGIDSQAAALNNTIMQSLNIQRPGIPDLQFVLMVSALCTSGLTTLNVPEDVRRRVFDRCWALVSTDPPPTSPQERVLNLRFGTELTLDALVATIRELFAEAEISTLTWDHAPSDPTRASSPAAEPLIDRLQKLYPDPPPTSDSSDRN